MEKTATSATVVRAQRRTCELIDQHIGVIERHRLKRWKAGDERVLDHLVPDPTLSRKERAAEADWMLKQVEAAEHEHFEKYVHEERALLRRQSSALPRSQQRQRHYLRGLTGPGPARQPSVGPAGAAPTAPGPATSPAGDPRRPDFPDRPSDPQSPASGNPPPPPPPSQGP